MYRHQDSSCNHSFRVVNGDTFIEDLAKLDERAGTLIFDVLLYWNLRPRL